MGCSPAFCGPLSSALRGGTALPSGGCVEVAFINVGFAIKHVSEGITQPLCTSFPILRLALPMRAARTHQRDSSAPHQIRALNTFGCISSIHNQLGFPHDALIVVIGMVSHDQHAVVLAQVI
jgi:hypothetical protein